MSLPNGDRAVVDQAKLTGYVLSETHPRGRNKARVFTAALGLTSADACVLETALRIAATREAAVFERTDTFGDHFRLDFTMSHGEQSARVRSLWTVRKGESIPRFVTAFVLRPQR